MESDLGLIVPRLPRRNVILFVKLCDYVVTLRLNFKRFVTLYRCRFVGVFYKIVMDLAYSYSMSNSRFPTHEGIEEVLFNNYSGCIEKKLKCSLKCKMV